MYMCGAQVCNSKAAYSGFFFLLLHVILIYWPLMNGIWYLKCRGSEKKMEVVWKHHLVSMILSQKNFSCYLRCVICFKIAAILSSRHIHIEKLLLVYTNVHIFWFFESVHILMNGVTPGAKLTHIDQCLERRNSYRCIEVSYSYHRI